jgi:hypothetical protein
MIEVRGDRLISMAVAAVGLKTRRGECAIRIAQGEILRCVDSTQNDLKDSLGMTQKSADRDDSGGVHSGRLRSEPIKMIEVRDFAQIDRPRSLQMGLLR